MTLLLSFGPRSRHMWLSSGSPSRCWIRARGCNEEVPALETVTSTSSPSGREPLSIVSSDRFVVSLRRCSAADRDRTDDGLLLHRRETVRLDLLLQCSTLHLRDFVQGHLRMRHQSERFSGLRGSPFRQRFFCRRDPAEPFAQHVMQGLRIHDVALHVVTALRCQRGRRG